MSAADEVRSWDAAGIFDRDVHCLLGLPFDAVDLAQTTERLRRAAAERRPTLLATPNLNFVVGCLEDRAFRDSVIHSDLSVADGMPLVWVARMVGAPIPERVSGAGIFERLGEPGAARLKVYFFGGPEGVAAEAARRLNTRGAGLDCVGHESPGFGDLDDLSREERIARINASGADLLVVSVGARRGQAWIERNRDRLAVPLIANLGAVVNFAAGSVRRAPGWMQSSGLEWLWRVKEEPALWRRYLGDGMALLSLLATRVVPLAWHVRRHRPPAEALRAAAVEETESWRERVIRPRGAWARSNLQPLRASFARNAVRPKQLRLDLSGVTHADTSFLGLLLLLYGARERHGLRLSVGPVSARVAPLLRLSGSEFLLRA